MSITQRILGRNAAPTRNVSLESYEDGIQADDLAQAQQLQIDQQAAMEELDQLEKIALPYNVQRYVELPYNV